MKYKILEHTADLKIKIWGEDLPDLFKNAAAAMYAAMTGSSQLAVVSSQKIKTIKISGQDYESLLVNFLNELLYLSDVENKSYRVERLAIRGNKNLQLKAELLPYPLPPLEIEIKGATYHDLKIKKKDNLYETTIVFDI